MADDRGDRMKAFAKRMAQLLWPQRARVTAGVLCGFSYAISNSFLAVVIKLACDVLFPSGNSASLVQVPEGIQTRWPEFAVRFSGWFDRSHEYLKWWVIAAIPAVMGMRALSAYGNFYFLTRAGNQAMHELRQRVFDHLLRLPIGYFNASRTGDLIARVLNDTNALKTVVENSLATLVKEPLTLIAVLIYLSVAQPRLTLISVMVVPLCVLPIVFFGRKVRKAARAVLINYAQISDTMQEAFTGHRIVKAYNLEGEFRRRFAEYSANVVGQTMRTVRGHEIPSLLVEFSAAVGVALVFLFVMRGGAQMTVGDFTSFLASIFLMYQPIRNLSRFYGQVQQARSASERLQEVLQEEPDILEPANPVPLRAAGADIEFDNVTFGYGERAALSHFNLKVKAGQMVALVGASGSGKTTVTNLLLRFFDPQKGSVRIGGVNVRDVATEQLRQQISVVTQEIVLFNDTIRANIRLGRPSATDAEVEAAAAHAHAVEFILQKPGGYEFVIGERGSMLSGGQKQRLAIARAILRDAPILILDEATSALDSESERAVQEGLDELMQGRTTICVAHRLSTIQKAHQIVVLANGRIVDQGTHAELIARDGHYRKLHDLQFQVD